jgi:tungstate transport system substrate-binding protein
MAAMCIAAAACGSPPTRLGTTFSLEQSGALIGIDTAWDGARFVTIVGPSGQILRSAAAGDLDVVVTHAPSLERRLVAAPGHAALTCPLFASRFAILGPRGSRRDPWTHLGGRGDASHRGRRAVFVSRSDSSGTHEKELELWRLAGVDPGPTLWYVESGASQAGNLLQASNWRAYTISDLPTFALLRDRRADALDLEVLVAPPGDTALTNPYTLYLTAPPERRERARALADWLATTWRERVLALRLPDGTAAFVARQGGCTQRADGSSQE